jgi:hypothetical protein
VNVIWTNPHQSAGGAYILLSRTYAVGMPLVSEACSAPALWVCGFGVRRLPDFAGTGCRRLRRPDCPRARIREQDSQTARRKQSFRTPKLPNNKAKAELPHSKPPKQQGGSRASALQRLPVRAASFVPRPLHSLAQKRTTTKSRSACAGLKVGATPKQQGGSRASALQTWLIAGGGLRSRRPCQDETASGNTRLRPSILTLPPEYLRLSPF